MLVVKLVIIIHQGAMPPGHHTAQPLEGASRSPRISISFLVQFSVTFEIPAIFHCQEFQILPIASSRSTLIWKTWFIFPKSE